MRIAISTESTNDLPKELLEKLEVKVVPYHIVTKNGEFRDGEMSVEDLLKSIIVVSANDAAVALAEHLYGSVNVFVEEMNKKAKS